MAGERQPGDAAIIEALIKGGADPGEKRLWEEAP